MKLLTETRPSVSRSRMPRSGEAASMSFSRGRREGLPRFVSVAGRRSTCLTAKRSRANWFSEVGMVSGIRSRKRRQTARTDAGEESGSDSRCLRRVARMWPGFTSLGGLFHDLGIITNIAY